MTTRKTFKEAKIVHTIRKKKNSLTYKVAPYPSSYIVEVKLIFD